MGSGLRRNDDAHARSGVNFSPSEHPLVVWRCYEPAGCSITLSESDLVQHMLILGSTGSGKTTLMIAAIQQLIQHQIGLLILDAKPDGTVARVTEAAAKAGRKADVAILGPEGTHALDLFGALNTYDDVETMAQWLMLGTDRVGGDNPYWHTTTSALIGAALTLLLARRSRDFFRRGDRFHAQLVRSPGKHGVSQTGNRGSGNGPTQSC